MTNRYTNAVPGGCDRFEFRRTISMRIDAWVLLVLFLCLGGLNCSDNDTGHRLALERAESAALLERPDWVRLYLQEVLQDAPGLANRWAELGKAYLMGFEGSVHLGIEALEKGLAIDPDNDEIRLNLARAYQLQGRPQRVMEVLGTMTERPEALALRAEANLAQDPVKAWQWIDEAVTQAEADERPYNLAARIAQVNGLWQEMEIMAEKARRAQPFEPSAAYLHAFALGKLAKETAQREAQTVFKLLKEFHGLDSGQLETNARKFAILEALQGVWLGSKASLSVAKIHFLLKSGRGPEAREIWENLATADTLSSIEKRALARLFTQVGWYQKASDVLAEIQPVDEDGSLILLRTELDLQRQKFPKVIDDLTQLIGSGKRLAPHFFNRAKAHLWLAREAEAEADLEQAILLAPWFAEYRIELAKLMLANGERKVSLDLLTNHPVGNDPKIIAFMRNQNLELAQ